MRGNKNENVENPLGLTDKNTKKKNNSKSEVLETVSPYIKGILKKVIAKREKSIIHSAYDQNDSNGKSLLGSSQKVDNDRADILKQGSN